MGTSLTPIRRRCATQVQSRRLAHLYITAAAVTLTAVGMLTCIPTPSAKAATLAAIFPPWWTPSRIFATAAHEGDIVDAGGLFFVLVLHARGAALEARLHQAGALLTIDPRDLGLCGANARRAAS